jgi:hypothetical protein
MRSGLAAHPPLPGVVLRVLDHLVRVEVLVRLIVRVRGRLASRDAVLACRVCAIAIGGVARDTGELPEAFLADEPAERSRAERSRERNSGRWCVSEARRLEAGGPSEASSEQLAAGRERRGVEVAHPCSFAGGGGAGGGGGIGSALRPFQVTKKLPSSWSTTSPTGASLSVPFVNWMTTDCLSSI